MAGSNKKRNGFLASLTGQKNAQRLAALAEGGGAKPPVRLMPGSGEENDDTNQPMGRYLSEENDGFKRIWHLITPEGKICPSKFRGMSEEEYAMVSAQIAMSASTWYVKLATDEIARLRKQIAEMSGPGVQGQTDAREA